MANQYKAWSSEEDAKMIEMIRRGAAYTEMYLAFDRTPRAIRQRKERLMLADPSLPRIRGGGKRKAWTAEELEKLDQYVRERKRDSEIAGLLGRPERSVRRRVTNLRAAVPDLPHRNSKAERTRPKKRATSIGWDERLRPSE